MGSVPALADPPQKKSAEDDGDADCRPRTGQVTEFPFPHSGNMIKELSLDAQGRMWYGTPSNIKVGYFVPPAGS